jgi:glycosyltransferase involved in cell wall biosynthesis
MTISTLHIDVEGGYGGSSISLFQLLSRLDRTEISPVVVHRQAGPLTDWYARIGIPTYHVPEICSFVPRNTKALKNFIATLPRLRHLERAAQRIEEIARLHDTALIHLNYEGLFLLAEKLRALTNVPMIAHSRAHLPTSPWGRWLARSLARNIQYIFFISPQEESRWSEIAPLDAVQGEVMWNIARAPLPRQNFTEPPEVIYLGNVTWSKGTDRLIDIALACKRYQMPPMIFAIYGASRLRDGFTDSLARRIQAEGLAEWVQMRGHIADPSPVLARAFALVRPSRENDPWGRDVVEAAMAGVPMIATGSFPEVVQTGINGFLIEPFDPDAVAARLHELRLDRALWVRMSAAGQELGRQRFGGTGQVERFTAAVDRLVQAARKKAA